MKTCTDRENRPEGERLRILFYGDSNTYGYEPAGMFGARYGADVRWTDRLAEKLRDSWEILPYGLNGRCIPELQYEEAYLDQMLANAGPIDVFAVMLGTNDVILTPHPDAEKAVRKMDAFLAWLCEKQAFRILLIAPPAMDRRAAEIPDFAACVRETAALAGEYEKLAQKHGTLYVNADAWQIGMSHDFVHLSEEGHRRFAENMRDYLETMQLKYVL